MAALLVVAGLVVLGNWQLQRRVWKLNLIAEANARTHATPVPAPGPSRWGGVAQDRYLHVRVTGRFLHKDETLVNGTSSMGYGYWVMTPLRTERGFIVLVNRGHIPESLPGTAAFRSLPRPAGEVTVTGLMRLNEPNGSFLRPNRPAAHRWYSRDVAAISAAAGLPAGRVAPYFVDADGRPSPGRWPAGGLTVIHFPNHHLIYAVTWYVMALGVAAATILLFRREWTYRRQPDA
jgi:surfeit locus 1 family protein